MHRGGCCYDACLSEQMLVLLYAIISPKALFLVFQDTFLLGSLVDGLNALLRIEVSVARWFIALISLH